MNIEVITLNERDTLQAKKLGADRVELVSAMQEGGLTPSYGTLARVLSSAPLPVHVMVRPHSYGFTYTTEDWHVIKEDISIIQQLGGTRIVFGCLTEDGQVDEQLLTKVIELAPEMDITFHRAFDDAQSQLDAYAILSKYSQHISRILTSGGKKTCAEGAAMLKQLVTLSEKSGGPRIMPGSGLSAANISALHQQIGAKDYHFGSAMRVDGRFDQPLAETAIAHIKQQLM
ncbi:copper homeostasis protein CutC [Lentibacillus saliphilus]|uniref:copper homeostasis protein CutC n=1 Tax=Lentibacillus saliphilus TaxID=2737028 RepID=UPI0031BB4CE6